MHETVSGGDFGREPCTLPAPLPHLARRLETALTSSPMALHLARWNQRLPILCLGVEFHLWWALIARRSLALSSLGAQFPRLREKWG